ncbi:hypothetical protein HK101_003119 [Irineochytrium annulatum]|nr:hypothetical protein HK101_003119 [Irineochytrium annulatum]
MLENDALRTTAVDWCLTHAVSIKPVGSGGEGTDGTIHAPFALYPTHYPRKCFDLAVELQPLFNALVDAIAGDHAFLEEVMDRLSVVDDFTGRCWEIYKAVRSEGVVQALMTDQPVRFGIHRSDYLLHAGHEGGELEIQQVELNTIASSFGSLSTKVSELHNFLSVQSDGYKSLKPPISALPPNGSLYAIATGISEAFGLYGNKSAGIKLVRKTLGDMAEQSRLEGPERRLFLGNLEVAIVYYRAGYSPDDYKSTREWDARLLIERSKAIKCPDIAHHLVGTKKVQQILAKPGLVERFTPSPEVAKKIRSCFTGLYPLDESPEGKAAVAMALGYPDRFVMKPQREGGGNNFYGSDVKKELQRLSPAERNAFILMDLIKSPPSNNILVRNAKMLPAEVVSELGTYGIWISNGKTVHANRYGGYLLRTKVSSSNEGGVAAGFAVLDSPYFSD